MIDKKVRANKRRARTAVRHMNKQIEKDIFEGRFYAVIHERYDDKYEDRSGVNSVYRVTFHDRANGYSEEAWFDQHHMTNAATGYGDNFYLHMNNFIINSDFWKNYKANK